VAGLFLVEMLVPPMVATPIANALQLPQQHLEVFAGLQGNTTRYLVMLVPVAWGAAALGEELIYRGFLFSRLTQLFAGRCYGTGLALIGQAALFSMGHTYLGPRGMLNAGILGLIAGAAYVANGRNLWPLIVAHGLVDTVGITVLYLGIAHG
jgi:membrane protease YdiL (CAAX protease family)